MPAAESATPARQLRWPSLSAVPHADCACMSFFALNSCPKVTSAVICSFLFLCCLLCSCASPPRPLILVCGCYLPVPLERFRASLYPRPQPVLVYVPFRSLSFGIRNHVLDVSCFGIQHAPWCRGSTDVIHTPFRESAGLRRACVFEPELGRARSQAAPAPVPFSDMRMSCYPGVLALLLWSLSAAPAAALLGTETHICPFILAS